VAETQTSSFLLRRSFDCAQDDRLGCHPELLLRCHPEPLIRCHPDRSGGISSSRQKTLRFACSLRMTDLGVTRGQKNTVIPTAVEGSRPVGRKPFGSLRSLRMTDLGVTRGQKKYCHPDRSGGISSSRHKILRFTAFSQDGGFADHFPGLFSVEFHLVKIKVILVCFFYEWYYLRNKKTNNHISVTHTAPPNTLRERAL